MEIADIVTELRDLADQLAADSTGANIGHSIRWEEVVQLNWRARSLIHVTKEWQEKWKRAQVHPVTKWDLISNRQRAYLDATLLGRVIDCTTCGWKITTEGEFARHYVVTDINYTNLGTCWTRVAPEYVGQREWWVQESLDVAYRNS